MYLGDGYIVNQARTYCMRIFLDTKYPQIIQEVKTSSGILFPKNKVSTTSDKCSVGNCVAVIFHSKYLPEAFPQHGKDKKHERKIVLQDWQKTILNK
jgi:hypothetical protein